MIDSQVEVADGSLMIRAHNYGRTVCTVSLWSIKGFSFLPHHQTWLNETDGELCMRTVLPGEEVEAARFQPVPADRHILGRLEYVNIFDQVQKSWYRFDLEEDKWVRRGGMHWNPMGMGRPRHHDPAEPNRMAPPKR